MASYEENTNFIGNEQYVRDGEDPQEGNPSNKRADILSKIVYLIVGFIICTILAAVIVVLIVSSATAPKRKEHYSFGSMFNSSLFPASTSILWTQPATTEDDETYLSYNFSDPPSLYCDLLELNPKKNSKRVLVLAEDFERQKIACGTEFYASIGNSHIVFKIEIEKIFRHSVLGKYISYDTQTKQFENVSPRETKQQSLAWCPKRKILAYVEGNNLFVNSFDSEFGFKHLQLSEDGDSDTIFNGIADWVYEEEVYGQVRTYEWSNDCKKLAWLRLDDSKVQYYEFEDYEQKNPYPVHKKIRIPTPGTPNPIPSVHVYDMVTRNNYTMDIGENTDIYIYDIFWANSSSLVATRLNRIQNIKDQLVAHIVDQQHGNILPSNTLQTIKSDTWIQFARSAFFLPMENGRYFVDVIVKDGHYNLALFDSHKPTADKFEKFLVTGPFDIRSVFKLFKEDTNEIFFSSTETGSTDTHIYSVDIQGSRRWISNITEDSESKNSRQGMGTVSASFSPNGKMVFLQYSGPHFPRSIIRDVEGLNDITVLKENSNLKKIFSEYNIPDVEITTINGADGKPLNAMIMYPPGFSPGIQYPVLMNVYGGPGIQLVTSSFSSLYNPFNMYVASLGFLVVTVDGRGTGGKGETFMTQVYKNLGIKETEDQIAVAKYLKTMSYVNPNQIAIWGWSYGGFMTLNSVTSPLNKGVFRLGMSVAPVTDWRYYDSAYTERFMSLPTAEYNLGGYQNTSILNHVSDENDNTKCTPDFPVFNSYSKNNDKTSLLIVHGTGDDNVHPLNTFNLATRLQTCGIQFDLHMYPNKDHSISGTATRKHLYRLLSNKLQYTLLGNVIDQE